MNVIVVKVTRRIESFLRLPMLPNYLINEGGQRVDVGNLTEEQLREIGDAWLKALILHAQKRRGRLI